RLRDKPRDLFELGGCARDRYRGPAGIAPEVLRVLDEGHDATSRGPEQRAAAQPARDQRAAGFEHEQRSPSVIGRARVATVPDRLERGLADEVLARVADCVVVDVVDECLVEYDGRWRILAGDRLDVDERQVERVSRTKGADRTRPRRASERPHLDLRPLVLACDVGTGEQQALVDEEPATA